MPAVLDVIMDLRCLQDPHFADRGIGRHAASLLALAREAPALAGARLVGLVDPDLPPLTPVHAALLDAQRRTAWPGAMARPVWFVSPSPLTHDPLFTARLVDDEAVFACAIVHDFIPGEDAQRRLATRQARLGWELGLHWLARHDALLANSHATAARTLAECGVAVTAVTGVGVDPRFIAPAGAPPRTGRPGHVLAVGGDDVRKNLACAVRAHAGCGSLQRAGVPLVVVGYRDPADSAALREVCRRAGGDPALLLPAGRVGDAALQALYRGALAVVVPSRAEGFSLPLVEAMASGVPAIASDLPAHRELVEQAALRFASNDDAALGAILARLVDEPGFVAATVAAQAATWPRFTAQAVARRCWDALAAAAPRDPALGAPMLARGARPRLALLTPLPPQHSGCADYSAASTAALGRIVELHVFTTAPAPLPLAGVAAVRPLSSLPLARAGFDRVVSVLGNSALHLEIFRLLLRHGGAAVAHDARMLGFYVAALGTARAQAQAARELGRPVTAAELDAWAADEAHLPALFLGEALAVAEPLLVHSARTASLLAAQYGRCAPVLPFCLQRGFTAEELAPAARAAARARLGVADGEVLVASFGYLHETKRPEVVLDALAWLRGRGVPARLRFVGASIMNRQALQAQAGALGLADKVDFGDDYLTEARYRDHLVAADAAVQLRGYDFGSQSGALIDAIAAGVPTVASAGLAEAMAGPDYVLAVPDAATGAEVGAEVGAALAAWPGPGRPEPARRAFCAARGFDVYARRLAAALGLG